MKNLFLLTILMSVFVVSNVHAQDLDAKKKKHKKAKTSASQSVTRRVRVADNNRAAGTMSTDSSVNDTTTAAPNKKLSKQFDSLGDNQVFVERVQNMDNDQKVRIVQNRYVDLDNRLEIGGNFGLVGGGDSYVNTTNLGILMDYHFNPSFAVGVRYEHYYNALTSEGKLQYDRAQAAQQADPASAQAFAGIDSPKDTELLTLTYFPIYGKLNLFDAGIAHFDVYTLVGAGKTQLIDGGSSTTFTAGGGLAVWLSQHFTTRLEARYQTYEDLINTSSARRENTFQGFIALGVLL